MQTPLLFCKINRFYCPHNPTTMSIMLIVSPVTECRHYSGSCICLCLLVLLFVSQRKNLGSGRSNNLLSIAQCVIHLGLKREAVLMPTAVDCYWISKQINAMYLTKRWQGGELTSKFRVYLQEDQFIHTCFRAWLCSSVGIFKVLL